MSSTDRPCGPAPPGDILHDTFEAADAAIRSHAFANGYSLVIHSRYPNSKTFIRATYRCAKGRAAEGSANPDTHVPKKRRTSSQRTKCPYRVNLRLRGGAWRCEAIHARPAPEPPAAETPEPGTSAPGTASPEAVAALETLAAALKDSATTPEAAALETLAAALKGSAAGPEAAALETLALALKKSAAVPKAPTPALNESAAIQEAPTQELQDPAAQPHALAPDAPGAPEEPALHNHPWIEPASFAPWRTELLRTRKDEVIALSNSGFRPPQIAATLKIFGLDDITAKDISNLLTIHRREEQPS